MRISMAAFALALAFSPAPAFAEDATPTPTPAASPSPEVKPTPEAAGEIDVLLQVELSEDQVVRYIAALADMQAAMADMPADAAEPDAKTQAKLEEAAKAHGFAGYKDYNNIAGNIALVVEGVDPETKTYLGPEKLIQRAIDEVKDDKEMSDADKTTATADLEAQLKAVVPLKYTGNVDVVLKHYDQLNGG